MQYQRRPIAQSVARLGGAALLAAGLTLAGAPVMADVNPYAQPDESWVSISGTVESVQPDAFTLDYGDGAILVEMDDGDRDADAYALLSGDKVTVSGLIDDDFFETTTIEASSVYVESINTTFWASSMDEETPPTLDMSIVTPVVVSQTVVRGVVSEVDDDEFIINTGTRAVEVDVDEMPYNPLDDEGYLKIEKGDYVKVVGEMDTELFDDKELDADYIVELYGS